MLFQIKESLDAKLVRELGLEAGQTAQQLRESLSKSSGRYSAQALYKELHKLQREGIVVGMKGSYGLALSWVLELVDFADKVYDTYLNGSVIGDLS